VIALRFTKKNRDVHTEYMFFNIRIFVSHFTLYLKKNILAEKYILTDNKRQSNMELEFIYNTSSSVNVLVPWPSLF
jgi:hypothetical protein